MAYLTSFQSRLDVVHSRIARKLVDNSLRLSGAPTDVLLVKTIKNKEGDALSHVVRDHLVVPVVWPPMKDVPYRSLVREGGSFVLASLVNAFDESEGKNFEVSVPHKYHVDAGNLLFRVFLDDDYEYPAVIGLEVVETLGDFTLNMLVQSKYKCALYTENLPPELLSIVAGFVERRAAVGY